MIGLLLSGLVFGLAALAPAAAAQADTASSGSGRCGDFAWCDTGLSPAERTRLLLDAMTLDDKVSLLAGDDPFGVVTGTPATGTSDGIARLGIPDLYMSDGPVGPREGQATAMPAPLALAAGFNSDLARRVGDVVANEVRFKGNDLVHAPTVDVMRNPLAGRTFEGYGEDPYLSSRLAVGWIHGAQAQGVIANVKHYAMNTQEGQIGVPPVTALVGGRQLVNAVVDERSLREIYLPPFEAAVRQAGVGTVMCAYNAVNGEPACSNRHLLDDVLRRDWGFDGFVLSDYYFAVKDTVDSVNNGTEIEMPVGMFYRPSLLKAAVLDGRVSRQTVDTRVGNILRTLFRFGFFDRPAFPHDDSLIDKSAHNNVARQVAEQGAVLLKNDGLLPLEAAHLHSIAVIGEPARTLPSGGGSSEVTPFQFVSPLEAITERAGDGVEVRFNDGSDADQAAALAADADVALVFVADQASEGVDKTCLSLDCSMTDVPDAVLGASTDLPDPLLNPTLRSSLGPVLDQVLGPVLGVSYRGQDELIEKVAAANPRSVVVMETGGPVLTPWRARVAGLLAAWYPGQAGGPALARVLFGDTDPGGRLPVTFPDAEGDTPTAGHVERYPGVLNQAHYDEGVFIGYRWYDANGVAPAYPFGFGLSYTRFTLSDLRVRPQAAEGVLVSLRVRNVGERAGWSVPQLYLGLPSPGADVPQPPNALKGFAKLWLTPGESRRVVFRLGGRAFSYWDVDADDWRTASGCYVLRVGSSSRDLPLVAAVTRTAGGWRAGGRCGERMAAAGRQAASGVVFP